ncbi:MAG: DUF5518 domain-containing protein [Halanaeroarchaeum sp.]
MALPRRSLRNAAIGAAVGLVFGYVPIVLLVAPLVGGAVAGALERDGWRAGATVGALAGVAMAVVGAVVTSVIVLLRFGELPFALDGPAMALAIGTLVGLVAAIGEVLVAAIGGGLGALAVADARRSSVPEQPGPGVAGVRVGRWGAAVVAIVVALLVGGAVLVAVTAVLDPLVWPSLLVAIPVGIVAGAAAGVLAHHYLVRPPDDTVNWRRVGVGAVAVALVFALAMGGLSLLGEQRMAESYESTYEYRVSLSANDSIADATMYVPVPAIDGASPMGERFVESVTADRYAPAIVGYDEPPPPVDFAYELVETDEGPMIAITTDRIAVRQYYYREVENETEGWRERIPESEFDPSNPAMGVQNDGGVTFTVTMTAEDPIETADPFGVEPLLSAQTDRTQVDCTDYAGAETRCFRTEGRVYLRYDTDPTTRVSVYTTLEGRNEWFAGGWNGNLYRQSAHVAVDGPQDGWVVTMGDLEVGVGAYPDPIG